MYGLMLNEKSKPITRISGPVSIYYLKPDPTMFKKYQNKVDFPLILGFGDVHQSYENLCDYCKDECVNIYDINFLRKIDNLALSYPIDFFTESSSYSIKYGKGQGILFDYFRKNTVYCHDNELRKKNKKEYTKICPTKNIRWHYADTRFFFNKIEGYMFFFQRQYLEKFQDDINKGNIVYPKPFGEIYDNLYFQEIKKKGNQMNIDINKFTLIGQSFSYDLMEKLINLLKDSDDKICIVKELSYFFSDTYFSYMNYFKKDSALYKQLYLQSEDFHRDIFDSIRELNQPFFINIIENLITLLKNYPYSIIYLEDIVKLLNFKQGYSKYTDIYLYNPIDLNKWIDIWDSNSKRLYYMNIYTKETTWNRPNRNDAGLLYSNMISEKQKNLYNKFAFYLEKILFYLHTALLDSYFISRLLKNPSGNLNSSLSLFYFGDAHTERIINILSKIFNYKIIYGISSNNNIYNVNRCLKINELLDIPNDLKEHSLLRNYESKKDVYLNRVYRFNNKKSKSRKSRKSIRKSRKSIRKSRKSIRKSRKSIRKSRKR
jgi:hypothetical protein